MKQMLMNSRFFEILLRRDFEFSELQGGLLAVSWGLWSLLPYSTQQQCTFRTLFIVAPSWGWSAAFLVVGAVQIVGVVRAMRRTRRMGAFTAMLLWLFTGILLAATDWHVPGFPVTICFALGSAWGYIRIGMLAGD